MLWTLLLLLAGETLVVGHSPEAFYCSGTPLEATLRLHREAIDHAAWFMEVCHKHNETCSTDVVDPCVCKQGLSLDRLRAQSKLVLHVFSSQVKVPLGLRGEGSFDAVASLLRPQFSSLCEGQARHGVLRWTAADCAADLLVTAAVSPPPSCMSNLME